MEDYRELKQCRARPARPMAFLLRESLARGVFRLQVRWALMLALLLVLDRGFDIFQKLM